MDTKTLLIGGAIGLGAYALTRPQAVAPAPPSGILATLDPPIAPTGLISGNAAWLIEQRYGVPTPTDAWDHGSVPSMTAGRADLRLADFPADNLPSGGQSNRISPSEMCMVYVKVGSLTQSPGTIGGVSMTWTRDGKVLYTYTMPADPSWWWAWMYSFIGHFDWEIDRPGLYVCRVSCNLGDATWQFRVVNGGGAGSGGVNAPLMVPMGRPSEFSNGRGAAMAGGGGRPPYARRW